MTPENMLSRFFDTPYIEDMKDGSLFHNNPSLQGRDSRNPTRDKLPISVFDLDHPALKNPSGSNHFDKLPDEVVLNIFGRLPTNKLDNMALVCCRFNRLINDPTLWITAVLNWTRRIVTPNCLRNVMKRKIRHLILHEAEIPCLPRGIANDPSFQLPHLTDLDLTQAVFLQKTLTVLFGKCKNLKRLLATDVGDDALLALADGNQELEYLSFIFSYGTTGEGIRPLLKNCRKLKTFEFTRTELTIEALSVLCKNLPSTLEHLSALGVKRSSGTESDSFLTNFPLDVSDLKDMFADCPELIQLNLDVDNEWTISHRIQSLKHDCHCTIDALGFVLSYKLKKKGTIGL